MKVYGIADRGVTPTKLANGLTGGRRLWLPPPVASPTLNVGMLNTDWTAGGLTVSSDTAKFRRASGTASGLKLTEVTTSGTAHRDVGSVDLTDMQMLVSFYLHPGSGDSAWTWFNGLDIDLFSNSSDSINYRLRVPIYTTGAAPLTYCHYGWVNVGYFPLLTGTKNGTQLFDITQVTRVRVNTGHTTNKTPSVTIAYLAFVPKLATARVALLLDNGFAEQYTMAMYARSLGLPFAVSVIGSLVGASGQLSESALEELDAAGVLLINHTWTHTTWANLTPAQTLEEVQRNADWMCERGWSRGAGIVSVPGSYYSAGVYEAIEPYVDAVYGAHGIPGDRQTVPFWPTTRELAHATVAVTGYAAAMAAAQTWGSLAILGGHNEITLSGAPAWNTAMDNIAAAVAAGTLECWRVDDVVTGRNDVAISATAEATHARTISVQIDRNAMGLSQGLAAINLWVSATAAFGAPEATGTDTFGAPSAGTILRTYTALADYLVQTDANGLYTFELTHNDAGTSRWVMVEIGGKIYCSNELTFDAV